METVNRAKQTEQSRGRSSEGGSRLTKSLTQLSFLMAPASKLVNYPDQ
jgi:hypothetical protein